MIEVSRGDPTGDGGVGLAEMTGGEMIGVNCWLGDSWESGVSELGAGRRNMESMVGRRRAPSGLDKKSAGRSFL
jgi:hypothetical protein